MRNHLNTPCIKDSHKDRVFRTQMEVVFAEFKNKPATMLEVSTQTGILRANLCRYVAKWRKQNKIAVVRKGFCSISKHRAGFLTTNQDLFPSSNQRKLF